MPERLDSSQIRERLEKPKHRETLRKAVRNQNKAKFHTLIDAYPGTREQTTEFLNWVQTLIPADKFQVFKALFRRPLKTTEITGTIFDKLSRVFNGLDRVTNVQVNDSTIRDDQQYYFNTMLNWFERWETEGFEYAKTEFNSVLIVDVPPDIPQGDTYPAPYFYWLFIEHVLDYEIADKFTGEMEWIAFKQPNNTLAFFDRYSYRVYPFKDDILPLGAEPLVDQPHSLGYCPARFFWNKPLDIQEPDLKENPILRVYEALEWYLLFYVNKHYADLFNSYPMYAVVESDCNYNNEQLECDGGVLRDKSSMHYLLNSDGNPMPCPVCTKKRLVGAGTVIERPVPDGNNPDFDPIKQITVDGTSLTYNVNEEKRLREDIIYACTGSTGDVITTTAVNEDQVTANYEEQTQILRRYKKSFEAAMDWTAKTICALRYGDRFRDYSSSLGSDFYIQTETELRNRYKLAKESGASEAELTSIANKIIETTNRNDPAQLERMLLLAELEPYRTLTRDEVLSLTSQGIITPAELRLKLNFDNYIKRFERENINITEYGLNMPYYRRIDAITNILKTYADESITQLS